MTLIKKVTALIMINFAYSTKDIKMNTMLFCFVEIANFSQYMFFVVEDSIKQSVFSGNH